MTITQLIQNTYRIPSSRTNVFRGGVVILHRDCGTSIASERRLGALTAVGHADIRLRAAAVVEASRARHRVFGIAEDRAESGAVLFLSVAAGLGGWLAHARGWAFQGSKIVSFK